MQILDKVNDVQGQMTQIQEELKVVNDLQDQVTKVKEELEDVKQENLTLKKKLVQSQNEKKS